MNKHLVDKYYTELRGYDNYDDDATVSIIVPNGQEYVKVIGSIDHWRNVQTGETVITIELAIIFANAEMESEQG